MLKITEEYVQFAWKFMLFRKDQLFYNNEFLQIIDPGEQNSSSGPDFFNVRIKIGNTTWAGNVEVHIKSSDWYRHNHQNDPAYDSVILHVVIEKDKEIFRLNGEIIPSVEIELNNNHLENYHNLILNNHKLPCGDRVSNVNSMYLRDWISKLMITRLKEKTIKVFQTLEENTYDWEETFYQFLGKSFGFRINSVPFSMLVNTVPLKTLLRFRNKSLTINAILFGQAGFLENLISGDNYYDALRREYNSVYPMLPVRALSAHSWQFMRSRPPNFPTVRISQFASLIIKRFPLFADIIECKSLQELRKIFTIATDKYWENHMLFGNKNRRTKYRMGRGSADIIIINSVLPVLFAYSKSRMRSELQDRTIRFLEELPPEKNTFINVWKSAGIHPESAFDSQALIYLSLNYCNPRRCLECLIGTKLIT